MVNKHPHVASAFRKAFCAQKPHITSVFGTSINEVMNDWLVLEVTSLHTKHQCRESGMQSKLVGKSKYSMNTTLKHPCPSHTSYRSGRKPKDYSIVDFSEIKAK